MKTLRLLLFDAVSTRGRVFMPAAVLLLPACFNDVVPDRAAPAATDGAPSTPAEPTDSTGSSTDVGSETGDTTGLAPRCGDGERDAGEACDDGNEQDGDGCSATCRVEPRACADGAITVGEDLAQGIGVCKDARDQTCEQDFETLCSPGWHLCSAAEHVLLNDGVVIDIGDMAAVGVIRCRQLGGSGHYTSHDFNADGPDSCEVGSSRADCPTNLGCNEGMHAALCCAPIPSCGNGIVDSEREECDDGDDDDLNGCSNACANRTGAGPHC